MRSLFTNIESAARSNATVLLRGETGTGKEVFAQAIHDCSPRAKNAFVKVNCAALPESMIESELFGHEKGSFTGAVSERKGRFELAHRGTLFLDEIGEISPAFQAKLLRVLQEGEFERVGGAKTLKVDTRIVCATNRNLEDAVANGQFRADLYYRINVVTLILPPLRDRPDDIPDLARALLQRFSLENNRRLSFSQDAIATLTNCKFPGNVRELENCVRRTATLAPDATIVGEDFDCHRGMCLSARLWKGQPKSLAGVNAPEELSAPVAAAAAALPDPRNAPAVVQPANPSSIIDDTVSADWAPSCPLPTAPFVTHPVLVERQKLVDAMERSGWVQAKAGRLLGLSPRQVGYALHRHGVEVKRI